MHLRCICAFEERCAVRNRAQHSGLASTLTVHAPAAWCVARGAAVKAVRPGPR